MKLKTDDQNVLGCSVLLIIFPLKAFKPFCLFIHVVFLGSPIKGFQSKIHFIYLFIFLR